MRILLSGSSGLIGTALRTDLAEQGHEIRRLVRRKPSDSSEFWWDPAQAQIDPRALDGVDAVINLSGTPIISLTHRWNRAYVEELFSSRVDSTSTLAAAIRTATTPPSVFLSQSGANIYGEGGVFTEDSNPGRGYLASICKEWEAAAERVPESVRVVTMRNGIVFAPHGGALAKLLIPLKLGLGGKLGSGTQYWPWISLTDVIRAVEFSLEHSEVRGPVNFVAPEQATVTTIVDALARALHRPALLPVPVAALRLGLGRAADELLLSSIQIAPTTLERTGFTFQHPTVESAAEWIAHNQ